MTWQILTHLDQHAKSLQARKRKTEEWVFADPIPDGTFINVGDFLERWTNQRVKYKHKIIYKLISISSIVCVHSASCRLATRW